MDNQITTNKVLNKLLGPLRPGDKVRFVKPIKTWEYLRRHIPIGESATVKHTMTVRDILSSRFRELNDLSPEEFIYRVYLDGDNYYYYFPCELERI